MALCCLLGLGFHDLVLEGGHLGLNAVDRLTLFENLGAECLLASGHPMQHPFHTYDECFLVLSRDEVPNENLVWKDTVLIWTSETVDLLMEMSNPELDGA